MKYRRKGKHIFVLIICIFFMFFNSITSIFATEDVCEFIDDWHEETRVITHALGATVDGKIYTNSIDTLQYNYGLGKRYFEADFSLTSDGYVVLKHTWGSTENLLIDYPEGYIPTLEEFKENLLHYKYTPTTFEELFDFMKDHNDVLIATDIKYKDLNEVNEIFEKIVDIARKQGNEQVLDQFIIQFYSEENYANIKSIYPFKHWIYALYSEGITNFSEVITFCKEHDISAVLMNADWVKDSSSIEIFKQNNIKVYVFTVNNLTKVYNLLDFGVYGIYSDYLVERDLYLREIHQYTKFISENFGAVFRYSMNIK